MAEDKPYLPIFGSLVTKPRFKFLHLSFPRSWILLKLPKRSRIEEDLNDLHSTSIILLSIFRELFEIWMPIFGENDDVDCNFMSCVKGKMISNPKEKGKVQAKQEGEISNHGKLSMASSSARQWLGLRNPRIVRVARSFGGKDRHSKVCTIRGLRDRRIRLSVPTAIQLYDLQERLGLSQPSKVIDWLLEVTKLDIDELPPLQIPQGFGHFPQQMLVSRDFVNSQSSSIPPFFDSANTSSEFVKGGLEDNDPVRAKSKGKWTSDHTSQDGIADFSTQIGAHNFFLNNSLSENTSSSSMGGGHSLFLPQIEDHQPSEAPFFAPSGSQLFFYPPSTMPSLFTPYPSCITTQVENDQRQFNHFQLLGSSLSVVPTLHSFPKLVISQNNGSQQKDNATGS